MKLAPWWLKFPLWYLWRWVAAFARLLISKNDREVTAEFARITKFEIDRNVVGLIHMLDSDLRGQRDSMIVRRHAATALGRLGDPRAIPYLMEMRNDSDEIVRSGVWSALGRLKAKEAEGFLLEGLTDPSPLLRMTAAAALGKIGEVDAIPLLRNAVDTDSDPYVRRNAVEALMILGDEAARDRVPDVLSAMEERERADPRNKRLREAAESGEALTPWVHPWETDASSEHRPTNPS